MDDTARVGVVQRLGTLENDFDGIVDTQEIVRAAVRRKRSRSVDMLRDNVALTVLLTRVVDRSCSVTM